MQDSWVFPQESINTFVVLKLMKHENQDSTSDH
jgi:hypothetical protein